MNVIIKPIISEKSFAEAKEGKYTFLVESDSIKTQIAKDIEDQYKVRVVKVMTANIKAKKNVRTKRRIRVIDASYKKARVKLAKGQKIELFEEKTKKQK